MAAASTTLFALGVTSTTGPYSGNDVNKWIAISGAGAAGSILSTIVTSFSTTSVVVVSTSASTTVTAAAVYTQIDSFMGISGDTRPVIQVDGEGGEQRVVGSIVSGSTYPSSVYISSLTGNATITALNNRAFPAANYGVQEGFPKYIYLSTSISSDHAWSSGGTMGVVRQNVTLISPDNYVVLQAATDRWVLQDGTMEMIGQGRDVGWGYTQYLTGVPSQTLQEVPLADFHYSGKYRRGSFRTWTIAEGGDPPEIMIGRAGASYPYGLFAQLGEADSSNALGIVWSRVNTTSTNLNTQRNNFLTFRTYGLQTSSNSAGQFWIGGTYNNTASDRRTFVYFDQLTNVQIADASDKFDAVRPRLGVVNSFQADGSTALDQTAAMFWVQSTTQASAAVRIRGNATSSSYKLTLWETGSSGANVEAWIDGTGAGAIDTSWTSPASDIAEWKVPWWDGNPKMEVRKARTVVFVDAADLDRPIARGVRGTHKATKLRLYRSMPKDTPLSFIAGVTTSNPAYAMGAAPIHHRSKYETDIYGTPLLEVADYVEWTETHLRCEGSSANGYKYIRERRQRAGFLDEGIEVPAPTEGSIEEFVRLCEETPTDRSLPDKIWIHPPVYSKQPRKMRSREYRQELAELYRPRPERPEWFCAGVTEKGAVPLHDDEPLLDSWWVLGEYGPGLLWVSI